MKRLLNLGCGGQVIDGWVNVDVEPSVPGAIHMDARDIGSTPAEVYDVIVAHHVLDMLTWKELVAVLAGCRHALRPDGVMRVSVADLIGALNAAERGDTDWFGMMGAAVGVPAAQDFQDYVTWYGNRKTFLTAPLLLTAARLAGFGDGWQIAHKATLLSTNHESVALDTRRGESIFVELIP